MTKKTQAEAPSFESVAKDIHAHETDNAQFFVPTQSATGFKFENEEIKAYWTIGKISMYLSIFTKDLESYDPESEVITFKHIKSVKFGVGPNDAVEPTEEFMVYSTGNNHLQVDEVFNRLLEHRNRTIEVMLKTHTLRAPTMSYVKPVHLAPMQENDNPNDGHNRNMHWHKASFDVLKTTVEEILEGLFRGTGMSTYHGSIHGNREDFVRNKLSVASEKLRKAFF